MKAAPFHYHAPRDRVGLINLLAELEDVKVLAGGQSLMPMMNFRIVSPQNIVDINQVEGLSGFSQKGDTLVIGALTRQREIQLSALVKERLPVIAQAIDHVGHYQTRARGTIGGSCCHLDPAAELPAICLLYDAEFHVAGPDGERTVSSNDWFQGLMTSALDEREVLTSIHITPWSGARIGHGFHEIARRHGDFAVAGSACLVSCDAAGVIDRLCMVVFGATENPVRLKASETALMGQNPNEAAIAVALAEVADLDVMSDVHVSAEYRGRMAAVAVRRAMQEAFARVSGVAS